MQLIEVATAAQTREFLEFPPRKIYPNDSAYIRPWNHDVEAVFDPARNKMFQKGEAIRWLLLDKAGATIGRVAAFYNRETAFPAVSGTSQKQDAFLGAGGMGFFECVNDQQAANMLFNACRAWLSERGLTAMDGPVNFGDRDQWWGLLTENFGSPIYRAAYNPPYYEQLFREYGFQTFYRQHSYYRSVHEKLRPPILTRAEQIYYDPRYEFRHMRKKEWRRYAEDLRTVYNKAWVKHEGIKPMSSELAQKMMRSMLDILDEKIIWFGYYDHQPVAFYINLPEINEIVRHLNGKLGWWEKLWFKYYQLRGMVKTMFGVVFGVVPEHQGKGVESALAYATSLLIQKPGEVPYTQTIMNWIGDFNPKMMAVAEQAGARPWRTHVTLRFLFDRTREFQRHPVIE